MPNYFQYKGTNFVHVSDFDALSAERDRLARKLAEAEALMRNGVIYVSRPLTPVGQAAAAKWVDDAIDFLSPDSAGENERE